MDFQWYAAARRKLRHFSSFHPHSILAFKFRNSPSFHLHRPSLDDQKKEDNDPAQVRHLTSSATCIESLLACPQHLRSDDCDVEKMARDFARRAIARSQSKWKSEGSASIYCRCRALPLVLRYLDRPGRAVTAHVKTILGQSIEQVGRFGIGEAHPGDKKTEWYPPNAFHTYYTLFMLELLTSHSKLYDRLDRKVDFTRRRSEMLLWARERLCTEATLHSAASSTLDSDQLAWALSIMARFNTRIQSDLLSQDLFRHTLRCLFDTQKEIGTWRHYQPLFHYAKAGNAYCYVFETFAVLVGNILDRYDEAPFMTEELRQYAPKLMALYDYAIATQTRDTIDGHVCLSWSSQHRTNHPEPESWATASVFAYAQALRRLIGCWTRETAFRGLRGERLRSKESEGKKILIDRGSTWSTPTVAEQLGALFVHAFFGTPSFDRAEPDEQPLKKKQARSAILYGPPGTGKTTLVKNVAKCIGWDYVELHASHFVADGLPNVQKRADEIFEYIMELDHTVVLFDEIDELVREREASIDAFGRFLTTSMLPKLTLLWNQRKVIYFVNTNHVDYFDNAITRDERFDAIIFVSPPSFNRKIARICEIIESTAAGSSGVQVTVTEDQVRGALTAAVSGRRKGGNLPKALGLAKLVLLRWDQLSEVAHIVAEDLRKAGTMTIDSRILTTALGKLPDPDLRSRERYVAFKKDENRGRRDQDQIHVYRIEEGSETLRDVDVISETNGARWLDCSPEAWKLKLPDLQISRVDSHLATVTLRRHAKDST